MRVIPLATVAILLAVMLSACGSGHRHALPGHRHTLPGHRHTLPGILFSPESARFSARSHNYSVRQLKAAFASQGINLNEPPGQEGSKFTWLTF